MHWILQDNILKEEGYARLVETLERFDVPYSVHKVLPDIGELEPTPAPEIDHANVICVGSYSLRHFARKYGWTPGVFDLEPFDFTVQRDHWREHMLNHDSVISTFESVMLTDNEMFVRPVKDCKHFTGRLMGQQAFQALQDRVAGSLDGTLVQVCQPHKIFNEHRFWVVKGEIVTSSTYKVGSRVVYKPVDDERFSEFVKARVDEWQPHEAFVIDVCDTPDGIKVVEINTLNSAGFYAGDMNRLVMALEDAFDAANQPSPVKNRP